MAVTDELVAELRPDAEKHLELVSLGRELTFPHDSQPVFDETFIVGCDSDVASLIEQRLEAANEVGADVGVVLKRDVPGLDVDPFAEPHVLEPRQVITGAAQACLQDNAKVLVATAA